MILSDTNIVIYLLEGDKGLAVFDVNMISISFITELELLSAKKYIKSQEEKIKEIIQKFTIYEYNNLIKQACINFRQKYTIKLPEAIVAATAFSYNLPLITADKQLSKITEIKVSLYTF